MKLTDFHTVKSYLDRIGAEVRSLKKAVVKENHGAYWTDLAVITFDKDGNVRCTDEAFAPTADECLLIKTELSQAVWPECKPIPSKTVSGLPKMITEADKKDVFWFYDTDGKILMAQVRKETKGERSYVPVTYWSDDQYRFCEPEGNLPLFGLETLKGNTTAIVHEGAKAARYARSIAEGDVDHPWKRELSYAAHVGFVGGALSPLRTDWSVLQKNGINKVIIVADNDEPGRSAVPKIAQQLRCKTQVLQFSDDWAASADIADPFPAKLFKTIGDKQYYIGPTFRQCLQPATWMTDLVPVTEKKAVPVLRHHARNEWCYVQEAEMFVNIERTDLMLKPDGLDAFLRPFSDTPKTTNLLLQEFNGVTQTLTYDPSNKGKRIMADGDTAINLYQPTNIIPQQGDPKPFLDFLEYLIPDDEEREIVAKWIATLVAKPERHIQFALLMISSAQGSGKSLLGEILARCVGKHNTSFPRESDIMDKYTTWLARKRLIVVNEVYSGSNWKLANHIKTFITDGQVTFRMMYRDGITMRNFANFYCCSNAGDAIKIDGMDRRWYVPTVAEKVWPEERFTTLVDWLDSGGVSIIAHWAENHGDYFGHASKAPMSAKKLDMIDESESSAIKIARRFGDLLANIDQPVMVGYRDVREWIQTQIKMTANERIHDSDQALQNAMKEVGVKFSKNRPSLDGNAQKFCFNSALADRLIGVEQKDYVKLAREARQSAVWVVNWFDDYGRN